MRLNPMALSRSFIRFSSTASSLIKSRSIPAPHCGSIRVLGLNNPSTRNAISKALLAELTSHIEEIKSETRQGTTGPTRALILTSEIDESFCAGADLKERKTFTPADVERFLTDLRGTLTDIESLSIPTISAVSSLALGGGLEVALSTHLRVFGSTSIVALPETRLGIIPGAGGTFRLPRVVGRTRALDMMLTGRRVTGAEAYFLGICDRLVEIQEEEMKKPGRARELVLEQAVELARSICEGGPLAIQALLGCAGQDQEAEKRGYDSLLDSKDRVEALKAFAEKRKPVYSGR